MKLPQSAVEAGVAAIIRSLELETGRKFYVTRRPDRDPVGRGSAPGGLADLDAKRGEAEAA